jgi:hypothetical protein
VGAYSRWGDEGARWPWGGRARTGLDLMLGERVGLNLDGSAGAWYEPHALGVLGQISAGLLLAL